MRGRAVGSTRYSLAGLYLENKEYDKAWASAARGNELLAAYYGVTHPEPVKTWDELGKIAVRGGRVPAGLVCLLIASKLQRENDPGVEKRAELVKGGVWLNALWLVRRLVG